MSIIVQPLPLLSDNYAWILRDSASDAVAVVDPAESSPVIAALEQTGGRLDLILLTHHHGDHIDGVDDLRHRFPNARVIGGKADRHRLPKLDQGVIEGDDVALGRSTGRVIETPGHTRGHIAFFFPDGRVLICGDTLFSLGCGRLLEGTAQEMFNSLQKLAALPPDTQICCGHEYTQSNARFALHVDPENQALQARAAMVNRLRAEGRATVPSRLADEMATNPFLRAGDAHALSKLRAMKDGFR